LVCPPPVWPAHPEIAGPAAGNGGGVVTYLKNIPWEKCLSSSS
jgi:hypothetical protein